MSGDEQTPWSPQFSEAVQRALARWPNVPACHGWLALDRRGRWRIQGGLITHPGATNFLDAHYACDEAGCWYVQNGPQRAYVDLELAPWIVTLDGAGELRNQHGDPVTAPATLYVTEHGDLLFDTARGLAAVSDRDVEAFAARYVDAGGSPALEALAVLGPDDAALLHTADGMACRAVGVIAEELFSRRQVVREPRP